MSVYRNWKARKGRAKMGAGENKITKKNGVSIEFDPFEQRTITRNLSPVEFVMAGNAKSVRLNFAHWRSSEYEFMRCTINTKYFPKGGWDDSRDAAQTEGVKFSCDLEPISPINENYDMYPERVKEPSGWFGGKKEAYTHIAEVDFSLDDALAIGNAKNLEMRLYSYQNTYFDLSSKTEKAIQGNAARVYHNAVDPKKFSKLKRIFLIGKPIKWCIWFLVALILINVYVGIPITIYLLYILWKI
jgi:hypothetical protein